MFGGQGLSCSGMLIGVWLFVPLDQKTCTVSGLSHPAKPDVIKFINILSICHADVVGGCAELRGSSTELSGSSRGLNLVSLRETRAARLTFSTLTSCCSSLTLDCYVAGTHLLILDSFHKCSEQGLALVISRTHTPSLSFVWMRTCRRD